MMYALTIVPFLLLAPQDERTAFGHLVADQGLTATTDVAEPERRIRILDVADLTGADRLGALREAVENELLDEELRYAALERYLDMVENGDMAESAQGLVDAIETFCELDTAGLRIGVPDPGVLIVAASGPVHDWIDRFLASMRGFDGQIEVELEIFKVKTGTAATDWDGRTGVLLDEAHAEELLASLQGAGQRRQSPAILTLPAWHASLFMGNQIAYVKDYQYTVLPGRDVEIADPVIDVVSTGTSIEMIAIPMGADRLSVEIQYTEATAETPFREITTTLGRHVEPVTIQLPDVRVAKVDARFELDPGSAIALSVKDPDDETMDIIVVMKATRIGSTTPGGSPSGAQATDQRR